MSGPQYTGNDAVTEIITSSASICVVGGKCSDSAAPGAVRYTCSLSCNKLRADKRQLIGYIPTMSKTETMNAINGLGEAQRQRALQLKAQIESLQAELEAILPVPEVQPALVDLAARGIEQNQAAELRARLKTFAADWDRPETAIYDHSPAR